MIEFLKDTALFCGLSEAEIEDCLAGCTVSAYDKGEYIFLPDAPTDRFYMLLAGAVLIGNDSVDGRRTGIALFSEAGTLFGEVFAFLRKHSYDCFAEAQSPSKILTIPTSILDKSSALTHNMLHILAEKSFFLNRRVKVLSCGSLRQRIAMALLQQSEEQGNRITMPREQLAQLISATRPAVSRELSLMQQQGLLRIEQRKLVLTETAALSALL